MDKICESSGQDLRQIINILQMWKNSQLNQNNVTSIKKDENVMINNFEAAYRLLNSGKPDIAQKYTKYS